MAEVKLESLQPNSHKFKEEQKRERLAPVVSKENIVTTKKPMLQRMSDGMARFEEIRDIVMPKIDALLDVADILFFDGGKNGRANRSRRRDDNASYNRTDYRGSYGRKSYSGRRDDDRPSSRGPKRRERVDYANIILRYRADAEKVIDDMKYRIHQAGQVSIAELLDMIGETEIGYNDNNWGWTDERDVGIRRVSNGYLIDVADPVYLD